MCIAFEAMLALAVRTVCSRAAQIEQAAPRRRHDAAPLSARSPRAPAPGVAMGDSTGCGVVRSTVPTKKNQSRSGEKFGSPLWRMPRYQLPASELVKLDAKASKHGEELRDNYLFASLYHWKKGVFPRSGKRATWQRSGDEWVRLKRNMSRREWIEEFFPIRDKDGVIHKLTLNPVQRRLMCTILRMERHQMPVRIQILKARQFGCSTLVQALLFEMEMRGEDVRGLIVAHNQDTSKILLAIAEVALTRMRKRDGEVDVEYWSFGMKTKSKSTIEFAEPQYGLTQITSAKTIGAGVGGTRSLIHFSEGSRYEKANGVHSSVLPSLPDTPGTFAFDESTAYGAQGKFYDDYWKAEKQNRYPFAERVGWVAVFFGWWENGEYCWTRTFGRGRRLGADQIAEVEATLDEEETWLIQQRWLRRWTPEDEWESVLMREGDRRYTVWRRKGVGWRTVDVDQLLWRRLKRASKTEDFDQDYPSRPEVAFRATGSAEFDHDVLEKMDRAAEARAPVFTGYLKSATEKQHHPRGGLQIWSLPEIGKQYVVVSDTGGGGSRADHAVAVVLDAESCNMVGIWRERCDPHQWGPKCALLAEYYNEAVLGFETLPSTHGLAAAIEAEKTYSRMYRRRRYDSIRKGNTDELGFHTNVGTKPLFLNRIKSGMEAWTQSSGDSHAILSRELIAELRNQSRDEKNNPVSNGTDDIVAAWGIALMVRDDCYAREIIRVRNPEPQTDSERYWAREKAREVRAEIARQSMSRRPTGGMRSRLGLQ